MEASAVPGAAPAGARLVLHPRLVRMSTDARLVELIRDRQPAAFEVLYDRYHRPVLSFCRHLLGDQQEAEDAVQQTFLAAWADLMRSDKPILLRGWLFTIARNRCLSILRARRDQPSEQLDEVPTEGLATLVQRRQDLRDLVLDMRRLPDDQRAALVLAELDALSHEEIADVLGVPRPKVKALVFQARESLLASRAARDADCAEIRRAARDPARRRAPPRPPPPPPARMLRVPGLPRARPAPAPPARRAASDRADAGAARGGDGLGPRRWRRRGGGRRAGCSPAACSRAASARGIAGLVIAAVGTAGTAAVTHDFGARHGAPAARCPSAHADPRTLAGVAAPGAAAPCPGSDAAVSRLPPPRGRPPPPSSPLATAGHHLAPSTARARLHHRPRREPRAPTCPRRVGVTPAPAAPPRRGLGYSGRPRPRPRPPAPAARLGPGVAGAGAGRPGPPAGDHAAPAPASGSGRRRSRRTGPGNSRLRARYTRTSAPGHSGSAPGDGIGPPIALSPSAGAGAGLRRRPSRARVDSGHGGAGGQAGAGPGQRRTVTATATAAVTPRQGAGRRARQR